MPRRPIYEAFVDQQKVMTYTRAPAQVRNEENSEFTMLDGKIKGKFLKLKPYEYIKMEWKFSDWKEYSVVELIFQEPDEDECELIVNQSKLPAGTEKDKLEGGWKNQIINPMSIILGLPMKS